MRERLDQELELLRTYYPDLELKEEGGYWIRIPEYGLPQGWSRETTPVVFEVKKTHPANHPYGIYVPTDLTYKGDRPDNANLNPPQPPFAGEWILLSWQPDDGHWQPRADLQSGSNLLNWVRGFAVRFEEGK